MKVYNNREDGVGRKERRVQSTSVATGNTKKENRKSKPRKG